MRAQTLFTLLRYSQADKAGATTSFFILIISHHLRQLTWDEIGLNGIVCKITKDDSDLATLIMSQSISITLCMIAGYEISRKKQSYREIILVQIAYIPLRWTEPQNSHAD